SDRELLDADRDIRSLEEKKRHLEGELATLKPNTPIISASGDKILDPAERLKAVQAQYVSANAYLSPEHPDVIKMRQELEALEREVGTNAPGEEVGKRLDGQRGYLATLLDRQSPDHPDVIRTQKIIAGLEEELARIAAQPREAYPFKAENPAYINIRAQLSSTSASLEAVRKSRIAIKAREEEYARRRERKPTLEPA